MNKKLMSFYALKYNPFSPQVPVEALLVSASIDYFCWRVESQLVNEGGFALLTGDPGVGKSVTLRLLAGRLSTQRDISVGVLAHATSNIADFYREMGDVFGVTLRPHNRWGGFKALRERWWHTWTPLISTWFYLPTNYVGTHIIRLELNRCAAL